MIEVQLTQRASKLARKGRQWFFGDDLARAGAADGALVRVVSDQGRDLGLGFHAARSKIRLRLCGAWPGPEVPAADEFFRRRIADAIAERGALRGPRRGVRLVHGESDGLPGLVVDEYADCLVLQATTAAIESSFSSIVPALLELTSATTVVARNDVAVRRLEGLPLEVRLLHGRRREEVEIEENGVVHAVRPFDGQKTGFYLDQRPARARIAQLAVGRSVLDLFAYQGACSLAALAGGARSALAIDQSSDALARAQRGAERNGLQGLTTREGNAFDAARALRAEGATFDVVVLDPPAFAKSRSEVRGAERGYRDLNQKALRLLAPAGTLVTCTCSHHVSRERFEDLLRQSAAELPFRVFLRERLGAGPDHPAWTSLPESEYLKVCVLQRSV